MSRVLYAFQVWAVTSPCYHYYRYLLLERICLHSLFPFLSFLFCGFWHFHTYISLCLAHICPPWLPSAIRPCLLLLVPFLPPNIPTSAFMSHICMHMYIYLNLDFTYERKWDSFLHSRPLSHAPNDWNSMNFITHVWALYPRWNSSEGFHWWPTMICPFRYGGRSLGSPW